MLRSQATEAILNKDWFGATQYYERLYWRDSSDVNLQYKYADACRLNLVYDIALRLYLRINAGERSRKFPLTHFWIGEILKIKGQYTEAKKWFYKFLKMELKRKK